MSHIGNDAIIDAQRDEIDDEEHLNNCKECSEPLPAGYKVTNCYYNGTHRGHGVKGVNHE